MSFLLNIRKEQKSDYDSIRDMIKNAFMTAEHTDGDEHNLVDRLRLTEDYIPGLSLVAEVNGIPAGYIMFSRIYIGSRQAIAFAPLAVHPDFQNRGIGRSLIQYGHKKAQESGYSCSVVLGSPAYYAESGYLRASDFGIIAPFDMPSEYYMVYPLMPPVPEGIVRYSPAFGL